MCGNGIRCVAKYVYDHHIARKKELHIETLSGVKTCLIHEENGEAVSVTVDMGEAILSPGEIPVACRGTASSTRMWRWPGAFMRSPAFPWATPTASSSAKTPTAWSFRRSAPGSSTTPSFPRG